MDKMQLRSMDWPSLALAAKERFAVEARLDRGHGREICAIDSPASRLREVVQWLRDEFACSFGSLVVEHMQRGWELTYLFPEPSGKGWAYVAVRLKEDDPTVPSISDLIYAADWSEREAEDLFGLHFSGHPKLGEFVLHEHWPEGVNPMRREFDAAQEAPRGRSPTPLYPSPILEAPGAMALPIGPVFSDFAESAQYVLETTGEEMIRAVPRFFYKYRAVEKIAEGRKAEDVVLLAERFSGTSAFAHGLAFCQAVEAVSEISVPRRATQLRSLFAELERLRHHAGHIAAICGSTGLDVAQAQATIIEEELLRLSCMFAGHRYLFGVACLGGVTLDLERRAVDEISKHAEATGGRLLALHDELRFSSSFLDRIEEVGIITAQNARAFSLGGPLARASAHSEDFRVQFPYAAYGTLNVRIATEEEGDGYARLRVLFREASESIRLIRELAASLADGETRVAVEPKDGVALGTVEAPIGAALHWVRLDSAGRVIRYHVEAPSFRNWLGFRIALEGFAFQDFPIILATFGLSNSECDR